MSHKYLYVCLVEGAELDQSFVQVFWIYAPDIGGAIDKVLQQAVECEINNPQISQVDPYDIDNLESDVVYNAAGDIFWSEGRNYFPKEEYLELPVGVIGSCIEGDHDALDIESGYTISEEGDRTTIEINVDRSDLFNTYSSLIKVFPELKVFWYVIHDHWDESESDVFYVNEALNSPDKVCAHISENLHDSIENGYVTLTSYVEEGATNINISDHKKVVITTYSGRVVDILLSCLNDLGYSHLDEFVTIDSLIHHWHYKPSNGKDRAQLIQHLSDSGFSVWVPGA